MQFGKENNFLNVDKKKSASKNAPTAPYVV